MGVHCQHGTLQVTRRYYDDPPHPQCFFFIYSSTQYTWMTYFKVKAANFAERWQVCTPGTGLRYKNHHRSAVQEVKPTAKCSYINMNVNILCQHSEWWRNQLCPLAAVVSGTWCECLALAPVCPQRFYQWLLETSTPHPTELTHREDLPVNDTIRQIKTTSRKANRKH